VRQKEGEKQREREIVVRDTYMLKDEGRGR